MLDVGRELIGGALGDIDVDRLTAAVVVVVEVEVEVELPLIFLGPGHDSISALGPFGGDLCSGFGAIPLGLRLDNGGVIGPVAIFIDLGAVGGLCRARGVSMETEGEMACDGGTTGDAHLLPCPGGVPRPVIGGGGATAGRGGKRAMECAWRRLGRGGNTTGVGGSALDKTGAGVRGGTETGFELEFVTAGDVSLISPSSCARRRILEFSNGFVGESGT